MGKKEVKMVTNIELANKAKELVARGGTYQEADCQAFVEKCFREIGVKCNYLGSNDMIRNLAINIKAIDNDIQIGDLVFWVRHNGREPARYKKGGKMYRSDFDGWNASHIGIYLGDGKVAESGMSIGHWAITNMKARKATHYGKAKTIQYSNRKNKFDGLVLESKAKKVQILKNNVNARVGDGLIYGMHVRVNEGEIFDFVSESNGWYAIRLKDRICWVSSKFAKVI